MKKFLSYTLAVIILLILAIVLYNLPWWIFWPICAIGIISDVIRLRKKNG